MREEFSRKKPRKRPLFQNFSLFLIFILWALIKIGDFFLWVLKTGVFIFRIIWRFFRHFSPYFRLKFFLPPLKFPSFKKERIFRRRGKKTKLKVLFPQPLIFKLRWYWGGFLTAFFLLFLPTLFYSWFKELPDPHLLKTREIPQTTKISDRQGHLLYQIYTQENRTLVKLSEIPDYLKKATIAVEDKDFYRHQGFNLLAIARAAKENLFNRQLQGGSTITQQLIKSALLTPEPTLGRKIKEAFLAFWAERLYSKDEILEMYFNQVPYGGTAWGVEAASQTYFGKKVSALTLSEAALLAGLPAAPTRFSPFGAHPQLSKERQKEVLKRMVTVGSLSPQEAQKAAQEELRFASQRTNIRAPHFVMYVKEQLVKKYGERLVEQGGLQVKTTLDLEIQEMAQEIVSQEIKNLENLWVTNGAALVTQPKTGEILAMVGSKDYFAKDYDGNVNVTLSSRQPGSAIKVITYATALENGFTAATILDDSPVTFQTLGSPPYSPLNYDGRFHGKIPLRSALGNSYNVPAVRTLAKIGVRKMIEKGKKMGISTWEEEGRFGLSLTLGGGEVTMLDMAKVYGSLANLGKRVDLTSILEVKDSKGEILETLKPQEAEVIPQGVAFILADILADNQARTAAFGPHSTLVIPGKTVSVKTGTTNDKRDNWTVGFTLSSLVAVWVGNNNNSPMHPTLASGITGAAPIWQKIMSTLLKNRSDEPLKTSEDVLEAKVCPFWGREKEYFLKGTEAKGVFCPALSPTPPP